MTDVESTLNVKLAGLLSETRYSWEAEPEQRGVLRDGGQIDVLITEDGRPPVIIECKIGMKSEDVDKRFDNRFLDGTAPGIVFEAKYDEDLCAGGDLADSTLHYCVHYGRQTRFPRTGWLVGSIRDLSVAVQYARDSLVHAEGADVLNGAIAKVADTIGRLSKSTRAKISRVMAQEQSDQTYAMAALTASGALLFHDTAAEPHGIPVLGELVFGDMIDVPGLLAAWDRILGVDYFPIFSTARKILSVLPADKAVDVVRLLRAANARIVSMGLGGSSDLYGQIFQRVISDRKKLAAFYTKPASAALLAAVTIPAEYDNAESVRRVRVADFACGTGTLLQAAYKRIAASYEAASGGSMRDLHPHMMAECLIGADVLPVAAHLTAAGLSGLHPKKPYRYTRIYQPVQGGKGHRLGSLEWIQPLVRFTDSEARLTGKGVRGESSAPAHGSCSIVVMNPPYVRSTGPGGRADQTDARQMFTAFNATDDDRREMSSRAAKLFSSRPGITRYCADKRAGMATFFVDLANAKLSLGGRLGLVLPMTAATGVNWSEFRDMMRTQYADLVVLGGRFSADTGIEEIIMSARKLRDNEKPSGRGVFVSLDRAPESALEGLCVGAAIKDVRPLKFEGKPHGGTRVMVGGDEIGTAMDCPVEHGWSTVGTRNYALHQIAHHIRGGSLYLTRMLAPEDIDIVELRSIADVGPSHLQIRGGRPGAGGGGERRVIQARSISESTAPDANILRSGIMTAARSGK